MICKSCVTCSLRSENKLCQNRFVWLNKMLDTSLISSISILIEVGLNIKIASFKPLTGINISSRQEFLYCCTFVLKVVAIQMNTNSTQFNVIEEIKLELSTWVKFLIPWKLIYINNYCYTVMKEVTL